MFYKNRHHRKNGHNRRHLLNIPVVNSRTQDFLHFGIHLVVFLLKSLPDASSYSAKCFVVNLFIFILWIFMIMVWYTFTTSKSWWHFPLSWHLGVINIKIDIGELNSFPKGLKVFIQICLTLEHLRRSWPMVVLLLQTSHVFGLFLKDYLFETTDVFRSGRQTRSQIWPWSFGHREYEPSFEFYSLLRVTIAKVASTLCNCLKLVGVCGHAFSIVLGRMNEL